MKIVLNNSDGFFTIESGIDPQGFNVTPLLSHCSAGRFNVEGLSLLVDRGAKISARDSLGRTCLHLCFGFPWSTDIGYTQRAQAGLAYLLDHGANPFAIDDMDVSVSELAYFDTDRGSSRMGDVWDAVLADFGFGIADFRREYPRVPRYCRFYTRRDFEELWVGREHLCPYYDDDEEIWITDEESDQDAGSASDESSDSDDGGVSML